ncbi:phosphotransferase [Niallia sp. 03133]|uniref:phosphotransferase n=1 Tax=Niallia sp. 03133 TaxID=3458060 RepID=UPI0040444513
MKIINTHPSHPFEQIVKRMNEKSKLMHARELKGGISAQVTLLEILQEDGKIKKMIVRKHGEGDLTRNPQIAAYEFHLLQLLATANIRSPRPYYLDQSCEILSSPYIVIEFIEGRTEFTPNNIREYIHQMASCLAAVHHVDCSKLDLSFLPKQEELFIKMLDISFSSNKELLNERAVKDKIKSVLLFNHANKEVILHGDFWPGNILWNEGKLASIIDWEDAAIGDPLADLANGRLEVLFHFGIEAMNHFTNIYQSVMNKLDYTNLPNWDLFAALRLSKFPEWGLEQNQAKLMRKRHKWFVEYALR